MKEGGGRGGCRADIAFENGCYLCVNMVQFPVGHGYYGEVVSKFRHEYGLYYVAVFFNREFLVAEDAEKDLDLCVEEVLGVMP